MFYSNLILRHAEMRRTHKHTTGRPTVKNIVSCIRDTLKHANQAKSQFQKLDPKTALSLTMYGQDKVAYFKDFPPFFFNEIFCNVTILICD